MGCCSSKNTTVVAPLSKSPSSTPPPGGQKVTTPARHSKGAKEEKKVVQESVVLTYTRPLNLRPYRVEDYFWEHKRKLIPDLRKMAPLDKRALEVIRYSIQFNSNQFNRQYSLHSGND